MKNVPLKELKNNLAFWTEEAQKAGPILVTKHNKPFVLISRAEGSGLQQGSQLGLQNFKPIEVKTNTQKQLLESLEKDRNE